MNSKVRPKRRFYGFKPYFTCSRQANGIEKVEGSIPSISTSKKGRVKRSFLFFMPIAMCF